MLSSALIGCFTVRLNVELCSDWLFQCGSMLSSALIGCFTVLLNVELCSDWLFQSGSMLRISLYFIFFTKIPMFFRLLIFVHGIQLQQCFTNDRINILFSVLYFIEIKTVN